MKVIATDLNGVFEVEPEAFADGRGFFLETYRNSRYSSHEINLPIFQTTHTHSTGGSLRGLHYQLVRPQMKLVYVVRGEILDVAVDIRFGSPNFGKWHAAILNEQNHKQLIIPPDFAHGFCVLSEHADLIYLLSDEYDADDQHAIRWSDPEIGINWPIDNPILSEKDQICPFLSEIPREHLPVY